jgi:hypothetical protein
MERAFISEAIDFLRIVGAPQANNVRKRTNSRWARLRPIWTWRDLEDEAGFGPDTQTGRIIKAMVKLEESAVAWRKTHPRPITTVKGRWF